MQTTEGFDNIKTTKNTEEDIKKTFEYNLDMAIDPKTTVDESILFALICIAIKLDQIAQTM